MTITVSVRAFGRRTTRYTVATAKQAKAISWNAAKRLRRGAAGRATTEVPPSSANLQEILDATLAEDTAGKQAIARHVEAAFQASLAGLSE